jgi:ribosomal protein S18 acetylase RimI-like enzyme
MKRLNAALPLFALTVALPAWGEEIRIATYNIEHFAEHFDTRELAKWAKTQPKSEELSAMITEERNQDNEDNWEIAQVLLDPKVNADVVFIQEGCAQEDLEYFNKRWLKEAYKTVTVFPSNSGRNQEIGILLKPGFEVLETKADYYKEKDTESKAFLQKAGDDPESMSPAVKENRLFARGPAFVKIKSPGGYVFWAARTTTRARAVTT